MAESNTVVYKTGFRFRLIEPLIHYCEFCPGTAIDSRYIAFTASGILVLKRDFFWDGPSGAIATKNFIRGSLIHDGLYWLMRHKLLDLKHRLDADKEMLKVIRQDGMSFIRSYYVYKAVRLFGSVAADPSNVNPIMYAP